jgi:probable rRNA maturation factor
VGYLTAHSMLHLLGYDHMEDDEKARMRQKEEQIMTNIKLTRED